MNFCFTADQQDLIDAAKDFFDGENTFERMRSIAKGQKVESLWPQFVELGLLGVMAHEKDGGMGQPLVLMAAIAEAAGYSGLPDPFIEVAGITIPLSASPEKLITGSSQLAVLSELRKYIDHNLGDGTAVKSIDPLRKLVKVEGSCDESDKANYHGAVLSAAQLIGLSQRMVDISVDYAKDRHQFSKPIGSFQAIKHHLANVYTQIEFTRPIIQLAAIKGGINVHSAKVSAIDTAMMAAETAIQVHGGMGYTYEVDLHLFMKRVWALCGEWGDRNYHMKKIEKYVLQGDAKLGPGNTFN